jgi:23S rRNA G2445 N2-methylase RlmL
LGFDNDKDIISEANSNKGTRPIIFNTKDVLKDEIHENKKNVVILNPPYGKRVGNKSEIDIKYYLNILRAIQKNFSPIKIGIIIPQEYSLRSTKELNILKAIPFKNGGIAVVFYILDGGVN